MPEKIIGIIGGMGPEAAASLFLKILRLTGAEKDQDHFHIIMDSNPRVPDRTTSILRGGDGLVRAIVAMGKNLQKAEASVAGIACITSHYFMKEIRQGLSIPILDALEETRRHVKKYYSEIGSVGVLATSGTVSTRLFDSYLQNHRILYPQPDTQEQKVMEAIYGPQGIKSGHKEAPRDLLLAASRELIDGGARLLLAGCTEIPLALEKQDLPVPLVDPMEILAQALIDFVP